MRFDSATSRYYAAKALAARRQAKIDRDNAIVSAREAVKHVEATPKFILDRLARVRLQLDRLDAMAMKETDPAKLDRLASAQLRLSEQERILANRPLPGSNRPSKAKSERRISTVEPVELEPVQLPTPQAVPEVAKTDTPPPS